MTATALTFVFTAQALLGLALLALYFRGARKQILTAIHLLLGAGGLEGMLYLIQAAPRGAGASGIAAAALVALALLSGLTAPMLGRRSRRTANLALAAHIGFGAAGFALFLAWANG